MLNLLILNLILLFFFIFVRLENKLTPKLNLAKKLTKDISRPWLLIFLTGIVVLDIYLLSNVQQFQIERYLFLSFSLLIIAHAVWLTIGKKYTYRLTALLIGLTIIFLRFFNESTLVHNMFILSAISWLGSFLIHLGFINKQRFFIISIIWFIYDIFYVWLTSLSQKISTTTDLVNFPLSLQIGNISLGTADLVWGTILISLIKDKARFLAISVLVLSNLIISWFVFHILQINSLPLLVFWIPIGIILLKITSRTKRLIFR